MADSLREIRERFPKYSRAIERLSRKNTSFHSLCQDYVALIGQIQKYGTAKPSIPVSDMEELKILLNELEQEMLIYLSGAFLA